MHEVPDDLPEYLRENYVRPWELFQVTTKRFCAGFLADNEEFIVMKTAPILGYLLHLDLQDIIPMMTYEYSREGVWKSKRARGRGPWRILCVDDPRYYWPKWGGPAEEADRVFGPIDHVAPNQPRDLGGS